MDKSLFFIIFASNMKFNRCYLKRIVLLFLVALGIGNALYANNELKILADSLHKMIDAKPLFVQKKEQRIARIKCLLKDSGLTPDREYKVNLQLYNEYKKFNIDSAIHYVDRNLELARQLNRNYLKYQSSLQLSLVYSMCGRYRDAELLLEKMKPSELPRSLLATYYDTYARFWEYYSISATNNQYGKKREVYQDSLYALMDHTSFDYKLSRAYSYAGRDSTKAIKILDELLNAEEIGTPNYAMITHSYAMLSRYLKREDDAKKYLMMSAIADIQNATRETASLQALALIQYEENNLADAFKFTQSAIDDVVSSGIHFRAMEIYKFYSIINTAYQTEEARSKSMKRALAQSNEELLRLNDKLNSMNSELNDKNDELCEINNIKEHYIAQFFDVCFSYIHKMEKYQNMLYKIAINKCYEELIKKLKSSALIDDELDALYTRFDRVFLNLYPTFVSDFNALLKDDEKIILKQDALLNRELRIYALLRLGITDSGKIANFLRCSTSTVYNYRTKMRNKAAVDRDEFENEIMKI